MLSSNNDELFACLIETEQILDDLMTLNYHLEKTTYDMTTSSDRSEFGKHDRLKDMLFENIVIKLYKLFEVHSIIGKSMVILGKQKIMSLLKPFWKKILSHESMITQWRNEIVAHSGKRAKDFKLFTEVDPDYFNNIQIILKVSRYAVIYLWALRGNLLSEYDNAYEKKDKKMENFEWINTEDLLVNLIYDEKKFFNEINKTLEDNKLPKTIFCGYDNWPINPVK